MADVRTVIVGPMSEFPADTSMDLLECSVGDLLFDIAAAEPDRTCVSWVDSVGTLHSLTYRQVVKAARVQAAALLADALPADRVALWAPNSGAWIVTEYAVALAGMVLVPLNPATWPWSVAPTRAWGSGWSPSSGVLRAPT